jgi:hypothetical protein
VVREMLAAAFPPPAFPAVEPLASAVLSDVVGALWTLPGFTHSPGNSVADDVRDFAASLATAHPMTLPRDSDEEWPAIPELEEIGVRLEEKRDGDTRIRDHEAVNIYSAEHHCWWRANASGYTTSRREAGVYTLADAYSRTSHCGLEKQIVYYRAARPADG